MDKQQIKILIVEDEKPLLDNYAEILGGDGYQVLTAIDGYQALELLATNQDSVKLIFLDLMMAGIDGLEVLRKLKADPGKYGNPAVVVLTNMTSERVIKEAFMIGANSYLIKSELEAEDMIKEANDILSKEA